MYSNTQIKQQDSEVQSERKKILSAPITKQLLQFPLYDHFYFHKQVLEVDMVMMEKQTGCGDEGGIGMTRIYNSKRSHCLKLYCICFAAGSYCDLNNNISFPE